MMATSDDSIRKPLNPLPTFVKFARTGGSWCYWGCCECSKFTVRTVFTIFLQYIILLVLGGFIAMEVFIRYPNLLPSQTLLRGVGELQG